MGKFTGHTITSDSALGSAKLERSLRFNRTDSAYITRTVGTTGNRRTWTVSFWMKFCEPTAINNQRIWSNESGDGNGDILKIELYGGTDQARQIGFIDNNHAGSGIRFTTDRGFRDNSWYHIMMAVDTTQATNTNRVKIYVNGDQLSNWLSGSEHNHPPDQNYDTCVNLSGEVNSWGRSFSFGSSTANYFDGYLTEINFIDGQQLSPTDVGFTDPVTGIWMPKRYEGTYGTNGYRLDFSDNTSTTTLGIDKSPNGNDFTLNNFSVAAGKNNDSLEDIPTNNFCTMNPLIANGTEIAGTHSNGLLTWKSDNNYATTQATFPVTTGRWYWECEMESQYVNIAGITRGTGAAENTFIGYDTNGKLFGFGYYYNDGTVKGTTDGLGTTSNNNLATSQTTAANGDILGIASDIANGYLIFYKNGTHIYTITGINNTFDWFPSFSAYGTSATWHVNYGQRPFTYTPPAGHKSLCSRNLVPDASQIVRSKKHFDILTYDGNSSANKTVEGLEFKPDFVWVKRTDGSNSHIWSDSVRGEYRYLTSASTDTERINKLYMQSFNTDGFTSGINGDMNNSSRSYVAWCWKGGSPKQITSGSVSFNDDGDYLNIGSSSDYAFGTGDYTIEAWVYHTSLDGQQTYVGDTYGNTAGAYFYKNSSNRLGIYYSSEVSTASESFAVIPLNKWVHVAVSRNSGTTRIFQDGTLATNTGASDNTDLTITQYYIGDTAQTSGGMIGFISNVRILKGTGLYTSNFTPPTSPLTNISNTVFLGCQTPNSSTTAAVTPGSISANDHAMPAAKNPFDAFCIDGVPHMTASSAGLDGGTIDPTGASINTKAGFSIITYTGNVTAGANIAHGLGKKPAWIIIKCRDVGDKWFVYHHKADAGAGDGHVYAELQETAAFINYPNMLNDTAPTDTLVTLHSDRAVNGDGNTYVMYSWAEIPGYSKFGTYSANGNGNGPYVSLGFRPAWVLIKNASLGQPWVLIDSKREPYNEAYTSLGPHTNNAEYESLGNNGIDFLADGFKIRGHGSGDNNYSTSYPTHVYMAFAEAPSVTPFDSFPNAR